MTASSGRSLARNAALATGCCAVYGPLSFVPAQLPDIAARPRTSSAPTGAQAAPRSLTTGGNAPVAAVALVGTGIAALSLATGARGKKSVRRAAAEAKPSPPPFEPSKQVGVTAPLGFFDPLGFAKTGDEEGFRILREAELKHGRVAMMASLGLVGQHYLKLPGAEGIPDGIGALGTLVGQVGFGAIFVWGGVLEQTWKQDPKKEVGNFGDPFGLGMYDTEMRNREINNGRFAMISVAGILAAELATGKDAVQQFGL